MFGSLGVPELLMIFAVALIVFGPRKLPELGRTLGKAMAEFKRATEDLKNTVEREVRVEELRRLADTSIQPVDLLSRAEPPTESPAAPPPPSETSELPRVD